MMTIKFQNSLKIPRNVMSSGFDNTKTAEFNYSNTDWQTIVIEFKELLFVEKNY